MLNRADEPHRFPDPIVLSQQVESVVATAVREADDAGGLVGISMLAQALSDLVAIIVDAYGCGSVMALDVERHVLDVVDAQLDSARDEVVEELQDALAALTAPDR